MNTDVLNMNRFGRYLVTDIKNAVARFGVSLLVMATISLTGYLLAGFFTLIVGEGWHSLGVAGRGIMFGITYLVLVISAPAKIYGFFTDKKEGSEFLMIPASTLEKTLSMILVCCVILPLVFFAVYFSLDQIICLFDRNFGQTLISAFYENRANILESFDTLNAASINMMPDVTKISSPWLYVDDMIESLLIFLLGALIFKSSKPAKTIGCLILISIVLSMIITPIATHGVLEKFKEASSSYMTPQELYDSFPFLSWTVKHAVLVDTISDTIVNLGLSIAIYFRIKKINH